VRGFVVVDLYTQAEFVPREVQANAEGFVSWLRGYGKVGSLPRYTGDPADRVYVFRSVSDLETSFWFDEQGALHVDRDNDVIRGVFRRDGVMIR
jgi:hypothetical protein